MFAFEKRLAEASFDNVQLRDPKLQDNATAFADLGKLAPAFDWGRYFDAAGMPRDAVNVTQPKFLRQFDRELATTPLAQWKTYLQWHVLNAAADSLSTPFVEENFAFNGRFLTGATQIKPRWKRCAEADRHAAGRGAGRRSTSRSTSRPRPRRACRRW